VNDSADTLNSIPAESWFVATVGGAVEYHLESLKYEIKQGRVHLSTLVWRSGMQGWAELEHVPLLRMLVTVQPSPELDGTSLELVTPAATVTAGLLDDLTDDETTVLEPEVGLTVAPNHWQASAISAQQPAPELTPTGNAHTEKTAELVTVRPALAELPVTRVDPDSTSIFNGLFDSPASSRDASDIGDDVVAESDIGDASNVAANGNPNDNLLAADNYIRDHERSESVSPESSKGLEDVPRRPAALAPQYLKSLPTESLRPILSRPATPRFAIARISTRPAEARPVFQAPKREPISEGLARSIPTRVFNEKAVSAATSQATPRPLYTPLIQPPTPVPNWRPVTPARTSPLRARASILPPLSPLPVTERQQVDNDTRTAESPATSTPKPKLERPMSIKSNRAVGVDAVIPLEQSVPTPSPLATNGAQATGDSSDYPRKSSPTLVGMPPRLEPSRASAGSTMDPTLAPADDCTRSSEPTIIGMPPRIESIRAPAEPVMFEMQAYIEPSPSASTELTFIGMPPRLEPSIARAESDQSLAPLSNPPSLGDSIYPSISSIHPALRGSRNVRRTLIMMGAVGIAAAASVVFAFTQSGREQQAESARSAKARAGNNAAGIPPAETTETVHRPVAKSLEVTHQESAAAADKPATVTVQANKSRSSDTHAPMPATVQPAADEKSAAGNSGARPHNNRLDRNAGGTPVTKSAPQVGSQPSRNKAMPTAEWDQGTVEKRAWMSPGF
jgi:hypothetical protein